MGCDECEAGRWDVLECPIKYVTEDIWDCIRYARLFEKGLPPIAGGVLDQAGCFVRACEMIWQEERHWKAE